MFIVTEYAALKLCTIYLAFFMIYIYFFAHLAASSNNFNDNDQNRILGKWKDELTDDIIKISYVFVESNICKKDR